MLAYKPSSDDISMAIIAKQETTPAKNDPSTIRSECNLRARYFDVRNIVSSPSNRKAMSNDAASILPRPAFLYKSAPVQHYAVCTARQRGSLVDYTPATDFRPCIHAFGCRGISIDGPH